MLILRTKCHSEREAYIEGYKDGAEQALNDSLTDALKVPEVKENGKAIKEMMDKVEEMKAEVPDIAEEAANEEKLYSENLQAVIEKVINPFYQIPFWLFSCQPISLLQYQLPLHLQ